MGFLIRMFCKHKWQTHAKIDYSWIEKVEGTCDKTQNVGHTVEVLICEKCGEIKKIKY